MTEQGRSAPPPQRGWILGARFSADGAADDGWGNAFGAFAGPSAWRTPARRLPSATTWGHRRTRGALAALGGQRRSRWHTHQSRKSPNLGAEANKSHPPPSTVRPLARGPRPSGPGWLAIPFGFWSGRALATGTAWAGLCLIHHHLCLPYMSSSCLLLAPRAASCRLVPRHRSIHWLLPLVWPSACLGTEMSLHHDPSTTLPHPPVCRTHARSVVSLPRLFLDRGAGGRWASPHH